MSSRVMRGGGLVLALPRWFASVLHPAFPVVALHPFAPHSGMNSSKVLRSTLYVLLMALSSCQLFNTADTENVPGRGATAFDPYAAAASGAIKLSLQMFNGCAMLVNGAPVAKGNSPVPDYPAQCPSTISQDPTHTALMTPTQRLQIMTDTQYFLNQITLVDSVDNVFTDGNNMEPVLGWFRTQSRFKDLDWTDLSADVPRWYQRQTEGAWGREQLFRNARWMLSTDDSFTLEVLDSDGTVRQSTTYSRKDFAVEAPMSGHTQVLFNIENVLPPTSPSDTTFRGLGSPIPTISATQYRAMVRVDLVGSTNPFKNFRVLGVSGDGALRLTWSLMPNSPFTFPVTFVRPSDVPPTCYKEADDGPTPCAFGLEPRVNLTKPANGDYYMPGERFDMTIDIQDGEGNRLHPKDELLSYADYFAGNDNGLTYLFEGHLMTLSERDIISSYQVMGPLQNMRTWSDVSGKPPYWTLGGSTNLTYVALIPEFSATQAVPGAQSSPWPTRRTVTLPADAEPGTYVAMIRASRQFMGERVSKGNAFFFQVGQKEVTSYPNRVGNCQTCHRGVVSLDNLRHGFSVDNVESCKGCHMAASDQPGRIQEEVHRIHMTSNKFQQNKADCRFCHLTRESAVRPSVGVCNSCHPSLHGDDYFSMFFTNFGGPTRFSNCAQTCHVVKVPSAHILPD